MTQYGLIGKTLNHSFSKRFFTEKFNAEAIIANYENYEIDSVNELQDFLNRTTCNHFNITIPYKESILPFLDVADDKVKRIGAVNCIKKREDKWYGTNTDIIGFEQSFSKHIKVHQTKALILGNGGASKAVQYVLRKLNIPFIIISRTFVLGGLSYADIDKSILENYPIIINTTPLGTYPNVGDKPPLPYELLTDKNYLFDLIYNPSQTAFLQNGLLQNATCVNGSEMLKLQALAAWQYWQS
jgi:shikimate dehydrogenase